MVRNILLTSLISTVCYFGALGSKDTKATLICLGIAIFAWAICIRRCIVINRRIAARNQAERMFSDYMRATFRNRR